MDDKVKDAFHQAYTGEAKAALRLKLFADKAEQEGYIQIAKLFQVIARSEEIHGERGLRMLREIKGTEKNLSDAFESETKVAQVAYDNFIKLANEGLVVPPEEERSNAGWPATPLAYRLWDQCAGL